MKITLSTYEFLKKFPNEKSARTYLEQRRWKNGVICPCCGSIERIQTRKVEGYFRCLSCTSDFTVRTGTIFERSHVALDKWLYTMYLMATSRKGISSLQLSKEIGVTQKTAWFMLQRLREACGNDKDLGLLAGIVEADETYIGGKEANKHESKKLKAGRGGDVKATVLLDTKADTIQSELANTICAGSILCTDEHRSYLGVPYAHFVVNHSAKQFVDGMAHTNA